MQNLREGTRVSIQMCQPGNSCCPRGEEPDKDCPKCPGQPPNCPSLSPWLHGALHAFSNLYLLLSPNLATTAQTKRHQIGHQSRHLISFGAWPPGLLHSPIYPTQPWA